MMVDVFIDSDHHSSFDLTNGFTTCSKQVAYVMLDNGQKVSWQVVAVARGRSWAVVAVVFGNSPKELRMERIPRVTCWTVFCVWNHATHHFL